MLKICLCISLAVNFVIILFIIIAISEAKEEIMQVRTLLISDQIVSKEELYMKILEVYCCEEELQDIENKVKEIESNGRKQE